MRLATLLLTWALAGCVTSANEERARFRAEFPVDHAQVQSVAERLFASNRDVCPWNLCKIPVHVEHNDGRVAIYGVNLAVAWASFDGSIGLDGYYVGLAQGVSRKFGKSTENEIAFLIGHEWAHFLLGHVQTGLAGISSSRAWEDAADCVGAVLAQRAGFDQSNGRPVLAFLGKDAPAIEMYSPPAEQEAKASAAGRKAQELIDSGKPIDKAAANAICGDSW